MLTQSGFQCGKWHISVPTAHVFFWGAKWGGGSGVWLRETLRLRWKAPFFDWFTFLPKFKKKRGALTSDIGFAFYPKMGSNSVCHRVDVFRGHFQVDELRFCAPTRRMTWSGALNSFSWHSEGALPFQGKFRGFFLTSGGPSEGEEKKDKKGLLFRCSGSEDVGGLGIRNTGTLESWKTLFDSNCFFVLSALVAGQLAETLCQQRWSFGSQTQLYPCVIKWIDSKGPFLLGCLCSSSWIKSMVSLAVLWICGPFCAIASPKANGGVFAA